MKMKRLWRNARLVTLTGSDWGIIENGAVLAEGAHLSWVGEQSALPAGLSVNEERDLGGALITPGLVDCHTHLVYGGKRSNEAEMRLNGASYEEISRAGGGIRSTVTATRTCSEDELFVLAAKRVEAMASQGVTTLEIKSGYGLSLEAEARCLQVARRLGRKCSVDVRTSYLGAHALPPEFSGNPDAYIDAVCEWMPKLHQLGLIDAVDAFCENVGFTLAQTRRVFETAQSLDLPVKLHAEQLSNQKGSVLAASFKALSCDHLEHLDEEGVLAMKAAGSVAVLLPGAFYMLRETKLPPIESLRKAGVPMAVSTDHNPGTSPNLSLPLTAHMASTFFRLTPLEAVRGMSINAARALGLTDRGMLSIGQRADLAVWDLDHPNELTYWFGHNPCKATVLGGQERT